MLALSLGMPLNVMLRSMPASELTLWYEFWKVEPFGPWRDDFRTGIVAASVFNSQRASKSAPIFQPDQFMPKFGASSRPTEEQVKQQTAALKSLVRSAGQEAEALRKMRGK